MPKNPINYQRTIIYKLCCNDPTITEIYVGHTTNFTKRKNTHHHSCCNENDERYNCFVYHFIRENGGWDNWSMIEIEEYQCENKRQAEARERYWIETLQSKLNKVVPTRTRQEYYEENKNYFLERFRQYHEENREKILERNKQRYKENREKLLERSKQYNKANREIISKKKGEKIECECGCFIRRDGLSEHRKTLKHLKYIENL